MDHNEFQTVFSVVGISFIVCFFIVCFFIGLALVVRRVANHVLKNEADWNGRE